MLQRIQPAAVAVGFPGPTAAVPVECLESTAVAVGLLGQTAVGLVMHVAGIDPMVPAAVVGQCEHGLEADVEHPLEMDSP